MLWFMGAGLAEETGWLLWLGPAIVVLAFGLLVRDDLKRWDRLRSDRPRRGFTWQEGLSVLLALGAGVGLPGAFFLGILGEWTLATLFLTAGAVSFLGSRLAWTAHERALAQASRSSRD